MYISVGIPDLTLWKYRLIDWVEVVYPVNTQGAIWDAHVKDMRWDVCSSSWSAAQAQHINTGGRNLELTHKFSSPIEQYLTIYDWGYNAISTVSITLPDRKHIVGITVAPVHNERIEKYHKFPFCPRNWCLGPKKLNTLISRNRVMLPNLDGTMMKHVS